MLWALPPTIVSRPSNLDPANLTRRGGTRRPFLSILKNPAGTVGKTQGGLPLGNPVCLWQTELFK